MTEYIVHLAQRRAEWEKFGETFTPIWKNALEQVDSALWLIVGSRYSQALSALHASIELMLKADLESVHPLFVKDTWMSTGTGI